MSTLDPDRWQALSPYLDQALTMPDSERGPWLEALRQRDPALAADLEKLLEEHRTLEGKGFLDRGPAAIPGRESLEGKSIGPYTLVAPIGQGGMGTVWLARRSDGRYERRVAVKFPTIALFGGAGERFKREGSLLGRLAHPHIAALIDAGVSPGGQPYLVLEHVDGEPIHQYCDRRGLGVEARIRLFLDVLAAVAHAHANLIVHRDLKPSNVFVTTEGEVKLLDFGIAKLLGGEPSGEAAPLTREGDKAMTPEFAAPEQITGGPVTTGTDVYALGVLLYLLLTGEHPAGRGPLSPAQLVRLIVETEPRRPSDVASARLRRSLRGDVDTIVATALKKDPRDRYASATALADDLRRHLAHEPIRARPDTLAYRAAKFVRRNRTAVGLATLAFAASLAGVAGTLIQARTARGQRDLALRQILRDQADSEFLNFLMFDIGASGKPFTVKDLLSRGEDILGRQKSAGSVNRAAHTLWLGNEYSAMDLNADGRRVIEKAYDLSRGISDHAVRAVAACTLGSQLARDQELDRAEQLVREGIAELPDDPQFAIERVTCLRNAGEVSEERGETEEGVARLREAQRVLRQSPFDTEMEDMRVQMDLAQAYSMAGRDLDAVSGFEKAAAALASMGLETTGTAVVLYNNWALELNQIGRPLDAEKVYRKVIEISRTGSTQDEVSPMVLNNYARSLRELDRLDEAADYSERAYTRAVQAGHELVINQSLLERARVYVARGDLRRAEAMLTEAEPRLRKALPAGHYAFAALSSQRALIALAKGDLTTASSLSDESVAIVEAAIRAGGEGAFYLPPLLIQRADIRRRAGRPGDAAADAQRALTLLQSSSPEGTPSSSRGRAWLALGRAFEVEGKPEDSRSAGRSAVEQLESALGPNHPDTLAAKRLADAGDPPYGTQPRP